MKLSRLSVTDFRNYESLSMDFSEGLNVIYGKNAEGKTNLLEAIWLFTAAKSFRAVQDSEMIRFSKDSAFVKTDFFAFGREMSGEITISPGKRKLIKLGGVPLEKTSELLGQFPCVLFSPDELHIVTGAPEVRRRFMDSAISAIRPAYYGALRAYIRIWKQKNALLKNAPKKEDLSVWNLQLSAEGARLMQYRKAFFEALSPICREMHGKISGKDEEMQVLYVPSCPLAPTLEEQKTLLYEALEKKRETEIYQGLSLLGPHRDEMKFMIAGKDARAFASQGQMKTCALSLKLSQGALLEEKTGEAPLVLLDDVFGELDADRRRFLLSHLSGKQVILTCTEKDGAVEKEGTRFFEVKDGKICIST